MVKDKEWFQKAIKKKRPNTLGGWSKTKKLVSRRRLAVSSRPKNWKLKKRYLSVARALQALANVTKDKKTRIAAKRNAQYFYGKATE